MRTIGEFARRQITPDSFVDITTKTVVGDQINISVYQTSGGNLALTTVGGGHDWQIKKIAA